MQMYEAAPGHWIPVGQTLETMYQGDAMFDQMMECGFMDDLTDGDLRNVISTQFRGTHTTWFTKDNGPILVKEMTDAHIVNTVRMLERRNATAIPTYPSLLKEATKRNLGLHCEKTEQCADDIYCNCDCEGCSRTQCYRPGCTCAKPHSERERISA